MAINIEMTMRRRLSNIQWRIYSYVWIYWPCQSTNINVCISLNTFIVKLLLRI